MTPPEKEPAREPEIATGTLAEIYAQQGLYDRALEIYRRMERRRPDDPEIARRIAAVEKARAERDEEAPADPVEEAPADPVEPADLAEEAPADPVEGSVDDGPPAPDSGTGSPSLEEDDAFRQWLESR